MSTAAAKRHTVEEYLLRERDSLEKHEFYDGEIFAMAGATPAHNIIAGNLVAALHSALKSRACVTLPSDMRVFVPAGLYAYPDASVVCGPLDIAKYRGLETLKNPLLIVEVLSKSTEAYDRGAKFDFYRTIPSLKGYLLVSQERAKVDHFARRDDGWLLSSASELHGGIHLPELDVTLALAEIYAKVQFPPPEDLTHFTPETEIRPHPGDLIR